MITTAESTSPAVVAPTIVGSAASSAADDIPAGKPVSGRNWKGPQKKSSMSIAVPSLRSSWDKKEEERKKKRAMKDMEKAMRDEDKKEKEAKRKRLEQQQKRRLENERKAEKVQVITNTQKLKKLSKKQWQSIQKR